MLHHGQGKWYPGEPLPRWAFSCYFRRDGEPVWRESGLIAKDVPVRAADGAAAEGFILTLARGGLPPGSFAECGTVSQ